MGLPVVRVATKRPFDPLRAKPAFVARRWPEARRIRHACCALVILFWMLGVPVPLSSWRARRRMQHVSGQGAVSSPVATQDAQALERVCDKLAKLSLSADDRRTRAAVTPVETAVTKEDAPALLLVVFAFGDGAGRGGRGSTRQGGARWARGRASAIKSACEQATAAVSNFADVQTVGGLSFAMLVPGCSENADGGAARRGCHCPDIPQFSSRSLVTMLSQQVPTSPSHYHHPHRHRRHAPDDLPPPTPPNGKKLEQQQRHTPFVVFVSADSVAFANAGLHPSTFEKMLLAARAREVDLVTVQHGLLGQHVAPACLLGVVCTPASSPAMSRAHQCHSMGAPIAMRVPVWLSPGRLADWTDTVVGVLDSPSQAGEHAVATPTKATERLARLFCAAREGVRSHALRECERLVMVPAQTPRAGTVDDTYACDDFARDSPKLPLLWGAIADAYDARARSILSANNASNDHIDDDATRDLATRGGVNSQPGFMLIVPWLEHGGADQFNVNLSRGLIGLGIRVVIVTTLSSPHPTAADFYALTPDVFHLPQIVATPQDDAGVMRVLRHLAVTRNVGVVMISHSRLGYAILPKLRQGLASVVKTNPQEMVIGNSQAAPPHQPQIRLVDFVHLEEMEWGQGGYARMSVAHAEDLDHTFAASKHVLEWMSLMRAKDSGGWGRKSSVAYIGVDAARLRPLASEEERMRARFEIMGVRARASAVPVIAYIARMVDQKWPELYFEIVRQLRVERRLDFVSIAIGGGPLLRDLKANISREPILVDYVLPLGMLDHAATVRALAASDILLLPSRNEGISLAVYEAMALGVTPVVSAVGGQCELVADGAGACLEIPRGGGGVGHDDDVHAKEQASPTRVIRAAAGPFVDELQRLIARPELRRARMRAARRRVETSFDIVHLMRAINRGLCPFTT